MPSLLYSRLQTRLYARLLDLGDRGGGFPGRQGGFSTAEGLAGAALAVVALIAIWAAMKTFGLDIIKWMQQQITSASGG